MSMVTKEAPRIQNTALILLFFEIDNVRKLELESLYRMNTAGGIGNWDTSDLPTFIQRMLAYISIW